MKKPFYLFILFVISLLCSFVSTDNVSIKGGLYEKQYDAIDKIAEVMDQKLVNLLFPKTDGIADYCKGGKIFKCVGNNVIGIKAQGSLDEENDMGHIDDSFKDLEKLETVELSRFDLFDDFLNSLNRTIKTLVLDHCTGFVFEKDNTLVLDKLDITIGDSYFKEEKTLSIPTKFEVKTLNLVYEGNDDTVSIKFENIEKYDKLNRVWTISVSEFPKLDLVNMDALTIKFIGSNILSLQNIAKYTKVQKLAISPFSKLSNFEIDPVLFKHLKELIGDKDSVLTYFGTDIPIKPTTELIDLRTGIKRKVLQEIEIVNAKNFTYDNGSLGFPFRGFVDSLTKLTFNNWMGGKFDLSKIENNIETLKMRSSNLNTLYSDLGITTTIQDLDLSGSGVNGAIPDSVCSISKLKLTNNNLFGVLPYCYSCYPAFNVSFDKNTFIDSPLNECDYDKIYESIEVKLNKNGDLKNIILTGDNIGFTAEEFNKVSEIQWIVGEANKRFFKNGVNISEDGYTKIAFNGVTELYPYSWKIMGVESIYINKTSSKSQITIYGNHFPPKPSYIKSPKLDGKECEVKSSNYLKIILECPKASGTKNITFERDFKDNLKYEKEINLDNDKIIFCKETCENGCNTNTGKCNPSKDSSENSKKGENSSNESEESEEYDSGSIGKKDNTSNVVLGIVILIFVVGLVYFGYNKFIAPNSTSTNNSSYRNLTARDEEEFEDGIPMKSVEDQEFNNNNNIIYGNSKELNQIKLKDYCSSFELVLKYGLVSKEWFSMISNGIKYLSSKIKYNRLSDKCLINPYQIKHFIQEVYYKYRREEYGFEEDEEKLLQLYPNLEEIRYLITMDYSATPTSSNHLDNEEFYLNYYSGEKIFKIKPINHLKKSVKSKITLYIESPTSYEPLVISGGYCQSQRVLVDQLIYSSKFGSCSNDLINLIKFFFKTNNLTTYSVKDYFSYSKDLIDSLDPTLESIKILGNNSLEPYSLSSLSRFNQLKSIQVQYHIHDILYHIGLSSSFINDHSFIPKFKESDYYGENNDLRNPCYKPFDDDIIYPFGKSIKRLCSVADDWYEMCESLANNNHLLNLSIGNSCILEEGVHPLRRYMNDEKFYISAKGKEKYYSSEEESDRFDLEEKESDSETDNENKPSDSPIEYINCSVIDDGSGGVIVFGGIPNKSNSDCSSSEEENDDDYIYDDSDIARCEKKITNRFKKKKKRKEKKYQEYLKFLNDRKNRDTDQFKTHYYQLFNEFSLPKSFTEPLKLIISNNVSLQSLTLKNFDIDINILSAFKNNNNILSLTLVHVLTNIQLEVFLESILPTMSNLKYLTIDGITKPGQNITPNLNSLLKEISNLKLINFNFNK
ncbi:hypothetical protein DICPUDRAFT_75373 [Dictyostelium purpureum]|uniref:IPT/TIG domain-containing protein n=1 Tax=Dictyostelium purpureum TaxID=5786 RepID=F0ZAI2_DICPU|nr:uncharacterized protein DICPUDRAFT_75373 [Dictyostelium purpureum]EGC39077.1 hypothetical protein DICPUDRAFT_75373 [Dictyostelium purpureum]|eukprot:XP_003284427.1 hypothetical protein DICPUDRAFT_75373 [Dictyostelium purpureum]